MLVGCPPPVETGPNGRAGALKPSNVLADSGDITETSAPEKKFEPRTIVEAEKIPAASRLPSGRDNKRNETHQAKFNVALGLISSGKYAEAERDLRVIHESATPASSADILAETVFWLGYCLEKQGNNEQAVIAYAEVLKKYPNTPSAQQAKLRLTQIKVSAGKGQ